MKRNKDGMIVVFVVVIIGIISLLYASLYILIGVENNIYNSLAFRTKAFYVAESGLERGVALVKQNVTTPFSDENPFAPQYEEEHSFNVTIEQTATDTYTITSTGIYANTKRIIEAKVFKNAETFDIQSWKEIN